MIDTAVLTEKLEKFAKLPVGWDYGRDGPASARAIAGATLLLQHLRLSGATALDVLPGANGTVTVVAVRHGEQLEIQCRPTGLFDVYAVSGDGSEVDVENRHFGDAICLLGEQGWSSLRLHGSCTQVDIVLIWGDTPVKLSKTQVMVPVCPSSILDVSQIPDVISVDTLSNTMIHPFAGRRQSSGEYKSVHFQKVLA